MNKTFKVLWNEVRRSYVVSSETQTNRGKTSKSTKTLIAACVTSVLALSAEAVLAGPGADNADASLQTQGLNYMDASTLEALKNFPSVSDMQLITVPGKQFFVEGDMQVNLDEDSSVSFGAGDCLINGNAQINGSSQANGSPTLQLTRNGNSLVTVNGGRGRLMVASSTAINLGNVMTFGSDDGNDGYSGIFNAQKTEVILNGNSTLELKETSFKQGAFAGGYAQALGGEAISKVTGNTKLVINTTNFYGAIGAMGGGMAVGIAGGQSTAEVGGNTEVDVQSGANRGIFGGGMAVVRQESLSDARFGSFYVRPVIDEWGKGGSASATSQNIRLNLGKDSSNQLVFGGGLALANQSNSATIKAHAKTSTGNVHIVIGEDGQEPVFASVEDKEEFLSGGFMFRPGVNFGVMGGGLAIAMSSDEVENAVTAPLVDSSVKDVTIDVKGGYNLAVFGGGLAASSGDAGVVMRRAATAPSGALAQTKANFVTMNFVGGETVGVFGGGIAIAISGDVGAVAEIGVVNQNVAGGSVDGLIGGGYAVDATNQQPQAGKSATYKVGTVNITATSGEIGRLALDVVSGQDQTFPSGSSPSGFNDYSNSMSYAMMEGKAGILGGGVASGLRGDAQSEGGAHVDTVNIVVAGSTVVGASDNANIYGGGLATEGALSTVGTANIQIGDGAAQGSVVNGDIYGGGLALGGGYDDSNYNNAQSKVGIANITLVNGTVNGNIYAGGKVIASEDPGNTSEKASAVVEKANVTFLKDKVFQGTEIDATGVTGDAALTFANDDYDLAGKTVTAFNKVSATGLVSNLSFNFGERPQAAFSGLFDVATLSANQASTLTIAGGILATKGQSFGNVSFNATNGILALGSEADAKAADAALSAVRGTPGLYLTGTVDLSGVNALIGNAQVQRQRQAPGVVIGSNGMLMIDAGGNTSVSGVIRGTSTSGIYFTNVADANAQVALNAQLEGFDLANNIVVDNVRYEVANTNNSFTFNQIQNADRLRRLGLDGFDAGALDTIQTQNDAASSYVLSLLDGGNAALSSGERRHAQLNAAFNLAAAGGVHASGIEGAMLGLDQVAKRASLTNDFVDGWTGFAEVTGTQVKMGGSRNMLETRTTLGGLVVGGEYTEGDWTVGALLNLGSGEVEGQGNNRGVENDVDFYGLQGYAAKRLGNFNLVGQLGWLMTDNDIHHAGGDNADVDASVYTIGARGEMNVALPQDGILVPYIGVNYLRVETDGYTTRLGFKHEDVNQDLINVPIGVAVTGNVDSANGWKMKPTFDVAYVKTFGDTNVETKTGVGQATMATELDVWSEDVARVRFGMQAQKGNMGIGFMLGGAAGGSDHREIYGQINAKYVF